MSPNKFRLHEPAIIFIPILFRMGRQLSPVMSDYQGCVIYGINLLTYDMYK